MTDVNDECRVRKWFDFDSGQYSGNTVTQKRVIPDDYHTHTHTHTHLTALFPGLPGVLARARFVYDYALYKFTFIIITQVSRYQKGKTNLDFIEARGSEWQWHQLGHMQVCTSLQTGNHASIPLLSFYRPDALPAAQPTASKHRRQKH